MRSLAGRRQTVDAPDWERLLVQRAGAKRVEADPIEALGRLEGNYRSMFSATAIADGQRRGEVQIYWRGTRFEHVCPFDLVRFLGQQIGRLVATGGYSEEALHDGVGKLREAMAARQRPAHATLVYRRRRSA